ncbi:MAG: rhomboid family intramembrane serine protease, partial [Acetatifactor sp.]
MQIVEWKKKPIVSATLVIINVIVYIICTFTGNLLYNMGRSSVLNVLVDKEYGRIVYSLFLHGNISHLFNNMLILFFLGAMIEKEVGHIRYAVFYFLSGIGGNALSLFVKVMSGDFSGSIGASGAIFGLDGVLLAMVLFFNGRMENVTPVRVVLMIVYSLYSGFTGANVDNAAHVGGLLTGFLAGVVMCVIERRRTGGTALEH